MSSLQWYKELKQQLQFYAYGHMIVTHSQLFADSIMEAHTQQATT